MITVEIEVTGMGVSYDFAVDETILVSQLIKRAIAAVAEAIGFAPAADTESLVLADCMQRRILSSSSTLAMAGVKSGSKLILA